MKFVTDKASLRRYESSRRLWEGIPGIERTRGGGLYCCFFSGGTGEPAFENYALLIRSADGGESWSEPVAAAVPEGENVRCFDPCLWLAPDGKLWFFWAVGTGSGSGVTLETFAAFSENPDDGEPAWSEPVSFGPGVMLNRPAVLSDGDVLFSIASWRGDTVRVYRSTDTGKTLVNTGEVKCPRMVFGEPRTVERGDSSLAMYIRTDYGIALSCSYDGGCTWTIGADSGLGGPSSRFYVGRLKSGRLLLVNHHDFVKRDNLKAMFSDDDGKTWYGYLMLDERSGVSYPDAIQAPDGSILIVYDRNRGSGHKCLENVLKVERELLMARVTEEDIAAGTLVSDGSFLKRVVHRLGGYAGEDRNPYRELERYTDAEYTDMLLSLGTGSAAVERMFRDYEYRCANISQELSRSLDRIMEQLEKGTLDSDAIQKRYVTEKAVAILRGMADGADNVPPNEIIRRIFDCVNGHVTDDASLDDMSEQLRISKYYMCYLFSRETGTTIVRYRNYRRITLAKRLLRETELSVTEIGERAGFGDASYFSKWFKQTENVSPSQYRKKHRGGFAEC